MFNWDAGQYLRFANERTRPAADLAGRISHPSPRRILDVGCGPGNSTVLLADRYPDATVLGIDNSPQMLEAAQEANPYRISWQLCDVSCELPTLEGGFDVVFSNACLQWVPDHKRVIRELLGLLRDGGVLAVQIPHNMDQPIQRIIGETAALPQWRPYFGQSRIFYTLTEREYFDILVQNADSPCLWKTTYFHVLDSHQDILDWYRGTGLRPYLDKLTQPLQAAFEKEILRQVAQAYPVAEDGRVLFPFPRLFFTALKKR